MNTLICTQHRPTPARQIFYNQGQPNSLEPVRFVLRRTGYKLVSRHLFRRSHYPLTATAADRLLQQIDLCPAMLMWGEREERENADVSANGCTVESDRHLNTWATPP